MTSKQEKLAAARRKLKEFQVKNRETDVPKHKNINEELSNKSSTDFLKQLIESQSSMAMLDDSKKSESAQSNTYLSYISGLSDSKKKEDDKTEIKLSDSFSNNSNSPLLWTQNNQNMISENIGNDINFCNQAVVEGKSEGNVLDNTNSTDCGLETNNHTGRMSADSCSVDGKSDYQLPSRKYSSEMLRNMFDKDSPSLLRNNYQQNEVMPFKENLSPYKDESNEIVTNFHHTSNDLNDIFKPLQVELQNHAQTITILVQQRNDVQNALTQSQNLLAKKSDEVQELEKQVAHLTSFLNNLTQRLTEAEEIVKKYQIENNEILQNSNKTKSNLDGLQCQLDSKEEEFQELRRKYEEKSKECQQLLHGLHEAQSQLSICQIQIQQFSTGEHSALATQVSELQAENLNLKQKLENVQKKLENESVEKVQSSQQFHTYAQQCNAQLSSLNSQLKAATLENENLRQENTILSKRLSEIEHAKYNDLSQESYKTEIADLHKQISAVKEENDVLGSELKKKEEDLSKIKDQAEVKDVEIKKLSELLEKVESDNNKLISELESPKANERLLAAIESDKVAAAKAVSQNQKLKQQVIELEKGIMKLSEEKLELADKLSHEKHVNKELQNKVENLELNHHNHDHHDDDHCKSHHHKSKEEEPCVNDSNEIEELRTIVRQLQEDKTELMGRLSSLAYANKLTKDENKVHKNCAHEESEIQYEDTKVRLQQMEEKVRKTMNEIAVLDEEKEKLEHLVLQLQGETETIGEYITLYQKQRMLLRQRAQEKDNQLIQLSKDKEELRSKLSALDELVQHLVAEKENTNHQSESKLNTPALNPPLNLSEITAEKIRALISEIGSTTLVSNHAVVFEHCSCCSGRLMTI